MIFGEEGQHSLPISELEKQLSAAQNQRQLCIPQREKEVELKDIPTILSATKKELDDLLASGSGDLSFNYTIEGDGAGESILHIDIISSDTLLSPAVH